MIKIAILTISDSASRNAKLDKNRTVIEEFTSTIEGETIFYEIIPDDIPTIKEKLIHCADTLQADIILTNGGTGFSKRDVTPEATEQILEKFIPGIPEAMRFTGFQITKKAMLSRQVAGIRGDSLIINLPGSSKGVRESLEAVVDLLPHALRMMAGGKH